MKNLFIFDAPPGPVKVDMVRWIESQSPQDCTIVKKFTTRDMRWYEMTPRWPLDLIHQSNAEFTQAKYDFLYRYAGALYGFHRRQLDKALDGSDNVFVVIRNLKLSERIKNEYSFVNIASVLVYADRQGLKERLEREGLNENEINLELQRNDNALAGYRANPDSYDEFTLTNCTPEDMQRHLDRLIRKYESKPKIQRNLVFVVMSFDQSQPKLDDYYAAMQRVVSNVSHGEWICKSLKDLSAKLPLSEAAKQNIASSRFVIADLTLNRPNVFYELGYAHGLQKVCVITMEKGTKPHFYPRLYRNVEYENAQDLETKLSRELQMLREELRI